jgi:hypothetical protein
LITYVDSSVVLRVVLGEDDQLAEWERVQPVASEILRTECLRTIDRYRLVGAMDDGTVAERRSAVLDLLPTFDLISVTTTILERAGDPFPTNVATLDAIHLASALALRHETPELLFATHDRKLATAAQALGFEVVGL